MYYVPSWVQFPISGIWLYVNSRSTVGANSYLPTQIFSVFCGTRKPMIIYTGASTEPDVSESPWSCTQEPEVSPVLRQMFPVYMRTLSIICVHFNIIEVKPTSSNRSLLFRFLEQNFWTFIFYLLWDTYHYNFILLKLIILILLYLGIANCEASHCAPSSNLPNLPPSSMQTFSLRSWS